MRRRDFLKFLGLSAASVSIGGCNLGRLSLTKSKKKPNIVIILSDDLGYAELSCQGAKDLKTPNIDSLAHDGIRCTNAYSSGPICAPTRAGLMTGRYQNRFGYESFTLPAKRQREDDIGVPVDEIFFSQILQKAGYKTGMIGKWHLGYNEKYRPNNRGFDEFFGFLAGGHDYYHWNSGYHGPIYRNSEKQKQPPKGREYLTDVFSDEAVSFIERHSKEPFLLYLAYNAVHTPLQVPEKYLEDVPKNLNEKRRKMIGMNKAMDVGIGKVLKALQENGLEDDTLVIFFNDNGGAIWIRGTSNAPLSGGKGGLREGGIRVPFIFRWPGRIASGRIYEEPIISLDIFPTIIAAAQQQLPKGRKIDGVNLLPYLTNSKKGSPHEYLFFRHAQDYAVRKGKFKIYIDGRDRKSRLYDLQKDIAEKNNISGKFSKIVKEFKDVLRRGEFKIYIDGKDTKPRLYDLQKDIAEKNDISDKYPEVVKEFEDALKEGEFKIYIHKKDTKPKLFDLQKDIAEKNDISDKYPEVIKELKDALKKWESKMTPPQKERHILKSRLNYRTKNKK